MDYQAPVASLQWVSQAPEKVLQHKPAGTSLMCRCFGLKQGRFSHPTLGNRKRTGESHLQQPKPLRRASFGLTKSMVCSPVQNHLAKPTAAPPIGLSKRFSKICNSTRMGSFLYSPPMTLMDCPIHSLTVLMFGVSIYPLRPSVNPSGKSISQNGNETQRHTIFHPSQKPPTVIQDDKLNKSGLKP